MIALLSRNCQLVYNSIVMTEYVYHALGYYGQKAPRTLQETRRIPDILDLYELRDLLGLFEPVSDHYPSANVVVRLMKAYNMLPNDAIILGHCLTANISYLASYDSDFQLACQQEGIRLIDSLDALNTYWPVS